MPAFTSPFEGRSNDDSAWSLALHTKDKQKGVNQSLAGSESLVKSASCALPSIGTTSAASCEGGVI